MRRQQKLLYLVLCLFTKSMPGDERKRRFTGAGSREKIFWLGESRVLVHVKNIGTFLVVSGIIVIFAE